MTIEIADAILDWLDDDDEPREFGAEANTTRRWPPYAPKNGPLETVEELLLVRGVTPQLLFGCDVNRNGMVDPDEMALAGNSAICPTRLVGLPDPAQQGTERQHVRRAADRFEHGRSPAIVRRTQPGLSGRVGQVHHRLSAERPVQGEEEGEERLQRRTGSQPARAATNSRRCWI
jgi:hypothetical protein